MVSQCTFTFLTCVVFLFSCGNGPEIKRQIRHKHMPRLLELVRLDQENNMKGLRKAAAMLAPTLIKLRVKEIQDPTEETTRLEGQLKKLKGPKGIDELLFSPVTYLGVTDERGIWRARSVDSEQIMGRDLSSMPLIQAALIGQSGHGIGMFPSDPKTDEKAFKPWVFAVPIWDHASHVQGVLFAVLPLWRLAEQLTSQTISDNKDNSKTIFWVYLYDQTELFPAPKAPPELTQGVPGYSERQVEYQKSPGGYVQELIMLGNTNRYGTVPLPRIGPGVGVMLFRTEI